MLVSLPQRGLRTTPQEAPHPRLLRRGAERAPTIAVAVAPLRAAPRALQTFASAALQTFASVRERRGAASCRRRALATMRPGALTPDSSAATPKIRGMTIDALDDRLLQRLAMQKAARPHRAYGAREEISECARPIPPAADSGSRRTIARGTVFVRRTH